MTHRPLHGSGQIIATSHDLTLNGGLVRELPQNPLNSGLGIILIFPDSLFVWLFVCLSGLGFRICRDFVVTRSQCSPWMVV